MTVVQEIPMTGHSGHQYQGTSDSMEGIGYDHTMKYLEYQVDTNIIHKSMYILLLSNLMR